MSEQVFKRQMAQRASLVVRSSLEVKCVVRFWLLYQKKRREGVEREMAGLGEAWSRSRKITRR